MTKKELILRAIKKKPRRVKDLCEEFNVSRALASLTVKNLEKAGLIKAVITKEDVYYGFIVLRALKKEDLKRSKTDKMKVVKKTLTIKRYAIGKN